MQNKIGMYVHDGIPINTWANTTFPGPHPDVCHYRGRRYLKLGATDDSVCVNMQKVEGGPNSSWGVPVTIDDLVHAEPDEVWCLIDDWQPGQERFLVCSSLLKLVQWLYTAKEVTKVTNPNSLNGGRGTKYGKLSWRGGHMPLVPPTPHTRIHIMHLEVQKSTASNEKQGRGLGT